MNTANPPQSIGAKTITINDIELQTQKRRKLPFARQFYVDFSVGEVHQLTESTKEVNNRTSWQKNMYFDGNDRSVFQVQVYQKHRVGRNELVGSLADTIGEVLGKLKDDVFEAALRKDVTDGPNLSIKFKLATEAPKETGADELRARDAIDRANEMVSTHGPPAFIDPLGSAVDGGTKIINAVETHKTTLEDVLRRLEIFNKIVTDIADIHPYTSLAWSVISSASKVLIAQKNRDDQITRLATAMNDVFSFVEDAEPLKRVETHKKAITLLIQQVTECGYFITEYLKPNFLIRTAKYTISSVDAKITDYETKLQELKTAFLAGVAVHTDITVIRMMNVVEEVAEAIVLDDLPYASGARYAREKGCLPGTRESLLAELCDILNDVDEGAPQVCLLMGVAGSGKSAVAHTIARLYDGQKRLGSSYCFARSDNASRNPGNLFSTIARDLSDHDPQFKAALWGVVKEKALRTTRSPFEQLQRFIIEPNQQLHNIGPLVIVIDAVDESGDEGSRHHLLKAIAEQITGNNLPSNLRFLITTRPESDILAAVPPGPRIVLKQMNDVPEDVVDGDIYKFIHTSLHHYSQLESSWPNDEWCRLLVSHSQHLFQWASTACRFIEGLGAKGLNPRKRFQILLQTDNKDRVFPLDELYRTVLDQLFTLDSARRQFRDVMAVVLALKEPLPLPSLSTLLGGQLDIPDIISVMGSLLDGVLDEQKPIRPLHTSFRDFLLDETRSLHFYIDTLPEDSLSLGHALLICMRNLLRFNICGLEDSRHLNADIPDLLSWVTKAIPLHLSYSCQHWMYHLQYAECSPALLDEVTSFLHNFFPYWLEAISLLSLSSPQSSILSALETCTTLKVWAKDQELAILASEAFQFIQVFAPVLRASTPHLYLSAMPQTPTNSPLHQLWVDHFQKHASITSGHPANWPAAVYTLQGHTNSVDSVAYSPDGKHIASGSADETIRVWSTMTGQCVAGPFQGHRDAVASLTYSPNGKHIVSGSWDKTIRIWDATSGQCIAGPFQGQNNQVNSVAYSPNGSHIIFGCEDGGITVWNATSGQHVAGPFWGHVGHVLCLAYSPDGKHIVSASQDSTVMIRDTETMQPIFWLMNGHTDWVNSVAYSPDGRYIVSGSDDNTIRIWNAGTGKCDGGLFEGHASHVRSVAYTPDGRYIISGSEDMSIRVWDVTTGHCVAGPLQGHTSLITSIACSPDGRHIISGSGDKTIRIWSAPFGQDFANPPQAFTDITSVVFSPSGKHIVSGSTNKSVSIWDATTGSCVAGPFQEHTDCVASVAYSPDGNHVVSGSHDTTIRVWNVTTAQCVTDPFKGHIGYVTSVAYSPDGKYIASGSTDETVRVWDVTTGECVAGPFKRHTGCVRSVAYSPDGKYVTSGSDDQTLGVWDISSGQCVPYTFQGHTSGINSVAYSPDGSHIVTGSMDETIRVWNASTGECVAGPFMGHTDCVMSVAYSPDGQHIVSGSGDQTIRIWDAITGQCRAGPFQGHNDWVKSVAYSPNGSSIVSGSYDCSVKVWSTKALFSFGNLHEEHGWIKSSDGTCFYWISPWYLNAFYLPVHTLVISSDNTFQVDSDSFLYGESWASCWK